MIGIDPRPFAMWELRAMAYGRRRNEWILWSSLLSLVFNRTGFGDEFTPTKPLEWWPKDLIERADVLAMKAAEAASVVKITMREHLASQGHVTR